MAERFDAEKSVAICPTCKTACPVEGTLKGLAFEVNGAWIDVVEGMSGNDGKHEMA